MAWVEKAEAVYPVRAIGSFGWDNYTWKKIIAIGGAMAVDIQSVGGQLQTPDDWTLRFQALNEDAVKGLMRSLGDAGPLPTNTGGETVLHRLLRIARALDTVGITVGVLNSIGNPGIAATAPTTAKTLLKLLEDILVALGAGGAFAVITGGIVAGGAGSTFVLDSGLYGGRNVSLIVQGAGATTVDWTGSIDNVTYYPMFSTNIGAPGGTVSQFFQNSFRYITGTCSVGGAGTVNVIASMSR